MNLAELAISKKTVAVFAAVLLAVAGFLAYFEMGKLEDPEFTIKTALVITSYPGATPAQVEKEVTDPLETALQQLERIDYIKSLSRAGQSIIWVNIEESARSHELPQIWDMLRRKVFDAQAVLPPGAGPSMVNDDFGDVFGVTLAVIGDGFNYGELKDYVDDLRRELLLVQDVAKVDIWGAQRECVYLDVSRARLAELNISRNELLAVLNQQNTVIDAGSVNSSRNRYRFEVGGEFHSVEEIGNLVIGGPADNQIRLRDIATVSRGYLEPASQFMRFNGRQALGLAVSTVKGGNVIDMGEAVKARLNELMVELPVGIEIEIVSFQSDTVQKAVDDFMISLIEAVVIVIALLLVFMGLRSGLIIGSGLLLTILVTFVVMKAMGIDMQRVSLGSLIIALGMLVDNAIVVTEGILVKLQTGVGRLEAARKTVRETAWPLLGATLVAVLAFLPVYIAPNNTGEYCQSLFEVVAISLIVSWVLAMTITPLTCHMYLKISRGREGSDPYDGAGFRLYAAVLRWCLRHKVITMAVMLLLMVAAVSGFRFVDKSFFPESTRPQLRVAYWLPEGSRIESVSSDLRGIERFIQDVEGVRGVASFIGAGSPRFYLPVEPEFPRACFAELIINLEDGIDLDPVRNAIRTHLDTHYPHAQPRVRKFPLGPPSDFAVEVRFRGPDSAVLHSLADRAQEIMRADPASLDVRDNWRQRVRVISADYSQARALRTGLTRQDLGTSLKFAYDGVAVGLYRENNKLLPIIARPTEEERARIDDLATMDVRSSRSTSGVPVGQIVSDITPRWEEPLIWRRDRQRSITAQCDVRYGTAEDLRQRIIPAVSAIELPPGYSMEWGGEFEKSDESRKLVFEGVPLAFMLMAFCVVALFNAFRQPLIIGAILPLAVIGVSAGLLITNQPFGFLSLLGALSLSGMLIKNAVVLIDQTDAEIREGKAPFSAVIDAAVSRIRPVLMAAISTVLGMTPLLLDEFWISMSVTIIAGLTFATILTLIVVPVLYALLFRIREDRPSAS